MTNGEGTKAGGEDQWNDFLCHCVWPPRLTWKVWGAVEVLRSKLYNLSEPEGCPESKEQLFWNIRTTHFKKNAVIHTHTKK